MKLRFGVEGYTSEWAGMMLYPCLFNQNPLFNLTCIAGREEDSKQVQLRLLKIIQEKTKDISRQLETDETWRLDKKVSLIKNLTTLIQRLESGETRYFKVNLDGVPEEFHDNVDAVGIYTCNPYHALYFKDAVEGETPSCLAI